MVCLSVTLLIVDPLQYCICYIRSGAIRCTLFMVLYLDRMCQCWLYSVLRLHSAELRTTIGPLFSSQCPSGTIFLALYSMVWDWRVSRAGPMFFHRPKMLYPYYSLILFFLSLLSVIGWYCGARVFWLIGCISLSANLALPTF